MEGQKRFEIHFHTNESSGCGHVPAAEGVKLYQQEGYSGIVVTDHFADYGQDARQKMDWNTFVDRFMAGYLAAKAEGDACGMAVYLGMELRFIENANDYLVFGITEEFLRSHEWLCEETLASFFKIAAENDLTIVQAHPFRQCCEPANPNYLHGVEIQNCNPRHDSHNDLAEQWAKENHLFPTVGSDFHEYEDLALAGICFDRMPVDSHDVGEMLRSGQYQLWTKNKTT